jgi:DNA-binding beta-propeller fold protein YncE
VSPDGDSVLVAEFHNDRVQQVRIVDGAWVRFVGAGVLKKPMYVDCNADVIAVAEGSHRITVLSWADGSVRVQFCSGGSAPGQMILPRGVRLLADGSGMVVTDMNNHRLRVFALSGEFVAALGSWEQSLRYPFDVLECTLDGSFIVSNWGSGNLIKLSRDGENVCAYGKELVNVTHIGSLPDGGMVVVDRDGARCSIIRDHCHQLEWIGLCVSATRVNAMCVKQFLQ